MIEAIILSLCMGYTCQVNTLDGGYTVFTSRPVEYSSMTISPVNGGDNVKLLVVPIRVGTDSKL